MMFKNKFKNCLSVLKTEAENRVFPSAFEQIMDSLVVVEGEHINSYKPDFFDCQLNAMSPVISNIYQKMVIMQCVVDNWDTVFSGVYAKGVVEQYQKTFARILDICTTEAGWIEGDIDVYWKDLAMARRLIYPAGAQIVEVSSGYGIKQGVSAKLYASLRFILLTIKQGGSKGYYQIHTHTPELSEFNPQGWNNCYLRIAEMLESNPQIKGIFGGSWFYDPQLKDISPRLMYLQQEPLNNGAQSFYTGEDKSGNAVNKSKTRSALFNEGKYTPKSYLLIWPRKQMIQWANNYKKQLTIKMQQEMSK